MRRFENWTEICFGIDYGRERTHTTVSSPVESNTTLTVVRPYNFKNWTTTDYRAHSCSINTPGIPKCSYNTSRAALATFLARESWDSKYANKAVVIDTPNPVGCLG